MSEHYATCASRVGAPCDCPVSEGGVTVGGRNPGERALPESDVAMLRSLLADTPSGPAVLARVLALAALVEQQQAKESLRDAQYAAATRFISELEERAEGLEAQLQEAKEQLGNAFVDAVQLKEQLRGRDAENERLRAIEEAAREWVRVFDADSKTDVEWSNAMQRLRIRLAAPSAADPPEGETP